MEAKRRILIPCIVSKEKEIIPFWDERIIFTNTKDCGIRYSLKERHFDYNLSECIFDMKTRKLEFGIEIDYYPTNLEFGVEEIVYHEKNHQSFIESKITEIIFEDFEMEIVKGKKMEQWWKNSFADLNIDENELYCIKKWKPIFVLEDGTKVSYTYQLKHKFKEK